MKLTVLLLIGASLTLTASQQCTVCEGGEAITNPDQEITLPEGTSPIPINDCQGLASVAGFVAADSSDCLGIQLFGELCGCPSSSSSTPNEEEQCRLCPNSTVPIPGLNLTEQEREEVNLIIQSSLGQDQSLVPSIPRTCEEIDILLTQFSTNSSLCVASDPIRASCGCPAPSSSPVQCQLCPSGSQLRNTSHILDANSLNNTSLNDIEQLFNISNENEATCGNLENVASMGNLIAEECAIAQGFVSSCGGCSAREEVTPDDDEEQQQEVEMCSLCPFGESTPWPEKGVENFVTPLPNCGGLEVAATLVSLESDDCLLFRSFSKFCGCAVPSSYCSMCRDEEMTRPDAAYAFAKQGNVIRTTAFDEELFEDVVNFEYTCELFDSLLGPIVEEGSETCLVLQLRGASCGCPDPRYTIAVVLKRVAAALSLLGSLFIVWEVSRDRKKIAATHHQLVIGISLFDIISSVGNLLSPLPLPQHSGTPGAIGNTETCSALGFFTQLGQTAAYFNFGLSMYFWLVICQGWKESTFQRIRYPVYGVVTFLSLAMSLAGLPFYDFGFHLCQILPPPIAASWYPSIFFFIVPLSIVLAGTTLSTIAVLLEVRRREKAAKRLIGPGDNQMYLTAKVFWKSVWYLSGFYLTYPIFFATILIDVTENTLPLFYLSSFFIASQGIWNFLVYVYTYRRPIRKGSNARASGGGTSQSGGRRAVDSNRRHRVSTTSVEEAAFTDEFGGTVEQQEQQHDNKDVSLTQGEPGKLAANIRMEGEAQSVDSEGADDPEFTSQGLEDCDDVEHGGGTEKNPVSNLSEPRFG